MELVQPALNVVISLLHYVVDVVIMKAWVSSVAGNSCTMISNCSPHCMVVSGDCTALGCVTQVP